MQQTEMKQFSSTKFGDEQNANMHSITIYYSQPDNNQGKFSISYPANALLKDLIKDLALGKASLVMRDAESFFNVVPVFLDGTSNNASAVLVKQVESLMIQRTYIQQTTSYARTTYDNSIAYMLEHDRLMHDIEFSTAEVILLNVGSQWTEQFDSYQENPDFVQKIKNKVDIFNIDEGYDAYKGNRYKIYLDPKHLKTRELLSFLVNQIKSTNKRIIIFDNTFMTFSTFTAELGKQCANYLHSNLEIISGYGSAREFNEENLTSVVKQLPITWCGKAIFEQSNPRDFFCDLLSEYLAADHNQRRIRIDDPNDPFYAGGKPCLLIPGYFEKCKDNHQKQGCKLFLNDQEIDGTQFFALYKNVENYSYAHAQFFRPTPARASLTQRLSAATHSPPYQSEANSPK